MAGADSAGKTGRRVLSAWGGAGRSLNPRRKGCDLDRHFGQDRAVETWRTILSGGPPRCDRVCGSRQNQAGRNLGITLGLDAKRIQFTPDLMRFSDILGRRGAGREQFWASGRSASSPGRCSRSFSWPTKLRASPRTQSAWLQAMQEQHITGCRRAPRPAEAVFNVRLADAKSAGEQESTYPLPEAQLDRFRTKIDVDYPDRDAS